MQVADSAGIRRLARDLGLQTDSDCVDEIRRFALRSVQRIVHESVLPVQSLDTLRWIVADRLGMKLEFIRSDADVVRIASENSDFHRHLQRRLVHEFIESSTEGITLQRENSDPILFRFLAVIDARGERSARAYFTAWHEVTHLVLYPPQLHFPEFRRSPQRLDAGKDPLEVVVDHVAGYLAFYAPLYGPVIEGAMVAHGDLTFAAIEEARISAAPSASLFSTAMSSIAYSSRPLLLVMVEMALKAVEHRELRSPQASFDFAVPNVVPQLRVTTVVPNDSLTASQCAIRRNMRVPSSCALSQAFAAGTDAMFASNEDQGSWSTSRSGALPSLPIHVEAVRRGRFVYGLIEALQH